MLSMNLWLALLLGLLGIVFTPRATGAAAIPIAALDKDFRLDQASEYFIDTTGKMTVESISALKADEFKSLRGRSPNFGYSDHVHWMRFQLSEIPEHALQLVLLLRFPPLDQMTLYTPNAKGTYQIENTGRTYPMTGRKIEGRMHAILVTLKPEMANQYFYLRFNTEGAYQLESSLMPLEEYSEMMNSSQILGGLYIGAMLIMAIYNFIMFTMTRSRKHGIYVLYILNSLLLTSVLSGYAFQYLWPDYPEFNKISIAVFTNFSIIIAAWFFLTALNSLREMVIVRKITHAIITLASVAFVFAFFAPYAITIHIGQTILALGTAFFIGVIAYLVVVKRDRMAIFFSVSFLFAAIAVIGIIGISHGLIGSSKIGEIVGNLGMVVQDALLTFALADEYKQIELENSRSQERLLGMQAEHIRDLDQNVLEKTTDIRSILDSLEQGIFTISGSPLIINQDYSAHLPSLLKTKDIFGQNPFVLLFRNSNVPLESVLQMQNIIESSIGENEIMFSMNAGLLISEFESNDQGLIRLFNIEWTPVLDRNQNLTKVLVTLRDTTKLKQLEFAAKEKSREMLIVKEIIQVAPAKLHRFFDKAKISLEKSLVLLESPQTTDTADKILIFIHTLKGDARSLGLNMISQKIHEVEDDFIQAKAKATDSKVLANRLKDISILIREFVQIEREKLGRSYSEEKRLSGDDLQTLAATIEKIPEWHVDHSSALRFREARHLILSAIGYGTLQEIFQDLEPSLEPLALQLGKDKPKINLEFEADILLEPHRREALHNCFLHILRNSMDHGIESAQERQIAGKTPYGNITVKCFRSGQEQIIEYFDDGRGLSLEKVRKKAISSGLISANAQLGPSEIAMLIFTPGFSTAEHLSEISGRGVGMSAVKQYIYASGGSIEVKVLPGLANGYASFKVLIRYPIAHYLSSTSVAHLTDAS